MSFAEIQSVNIPFPPPYMLDCTLSQDEFFIFNCIWRSDRIPDDVKAELEQLEKSIDILPSLIPPKLGSNHRRPPLWHLVLAAAQLYAIIATLARPFFRAQKTA